MFSSSKLKPHNCERSSDFPGMAFTSTSNDLVHSGQVFAFYTDSVHMSMAMVAKSRTGGAWQGA